MAEIFTGIDCTDEGQRTELPKDFVPAMAYVPFQQWSDTYDVTNGFNKGTIFPILDKPFEGRGEYK
ncbi:MAG: spore coat associated protein CotJA [Clostridia bacterium]